MSTKLYMKIRKYTVGRYIEQNIRVSKLTMNFIHNIFWNSVYNSIPTHIVNILTPVTVGLKKKWFCRWYFKIV